MPSISLPSLDGYKPSESGNPIKPGEYDLKIKRILDKRTENAGDAIIVELEVLKTYSGPHQPGTQVSYFQSLVKLKIAGVNLANFMVAALGLDWSNKEQQAQAEANVLPRLTALYKAAIDGNPEILAALKHVHCVAKPKTSKPNPSGETHDYVALSWRPAVAA